MAERKLRIRVRVFREGGALLARLAHDLELGLERFRLRETGSHVEFDFRPDDLKVVGALVDGEVDPQRLGPSKHREIEQNIRKDVLRTNEFPEARFTGSVAEQADTVFVTGELELVGVTRPISLSLMRDGSMHRGSLTVTPSDWGIHPFQALLGALKLEDRVEVRIQVQQ